MRSLPQAPTSADDSYCCKYFIRLLVSVLLQSTCKQSPVTKATTMNSKLYTSLIIATSLLQQLTAQTHANRSLSNLTTITSVNATLLPAASNSLNLGSNAAKWKTLYLYNLAFANGSIQTTAFIPYTAGAGISIVNNQIINQSPSQWSINGTSLYYNAGNVGIGTNNPAAKLQVAGGDALINGLTVGTGSGNLNSNTVVGQQALYSNTIGFSNTVYGNQAMQANTAGYDNSAVGENALFSNVDGIENTAMGNSTLYYNVSGYGNTAVGNGALLNNGAVPNPFAAPEGSYNTASGFLALANNSTGSNNAAFGTAALNTNTTGNYNTAVGAYSDAAAEDLQNASALGANSIVNNSNKIRLGDVNVTVVESAAGSWTTSDGRFKTNVKETVVGLPFIKLLRPVTYNFDAAKFDAFLSERFPDSIKAKRKDALRKGNVRSATVIQTGFIAQEVADAAKKAGYNFNGVHIPENTADNYSISYEKIVVPLVKSVQELSLQNEEMKTQIAQLQAAIAALLEKNNPQNIPLSAASLQQNAPNPFNGTTSISYNIPANTRMAELLITGKQGNTFKRIQLTGTGKSSVTINTAALAAGTYQYSLYIDGSIVESRQMTVIK